MLENLNSMQLPPQVCAAETLTLYIIDFYGRLICKYDSFIVFYILLVFLINFFIIYTYILFPDFFQASSFQLLKLENLLR